MRWGLVAWLCGNDGTVGGVLAAVSGIAYDYERIVIRRRGPIIGISPTWAPQLLRSLLSEHLDGAFLNWATKESKGGQSKRFNNERSFH
jgi:hypothetical protein